MPPADRGKSPPLQPGYGRPDHRAHQHREQQDENDLVEPIELPEAQGDEDNNKGRPNDSPKCPVIRLRRWIK